jgi:hypothetical protein
MFILPTVTLAELLQMNSGQMVEIEKQQAGFYHIPSTMPYKRAVDLGTFGRILGLLYEFPFLNGASHQAPYMMKEDAPSLLLAVIYARQCHKPPCLFEVPANEIVDMTLKFVFPPAWENHLETVFDRLEVFLSIFFLFGHELVAPGIGSS